MSEKPGGKRLNSSVEDGAYVGYKGAEDKAESAERKVDGTGDDQVRALDNHTHQAGNIPALQLDHLQREAGNVQPLAGPRSRCSNSEVHEEGEVCMGNSNNLQQQLSRAGVEENVTNAADSTSKVKLMGDDLSCNVGGGDGA